MKAFILSLAIATLPLGAQDLANLPDWARTAAAAAAMEAPPKDAPAWVLHEHFEIAYTGKGEIRIHARRLVKILGEKGLKYGRFERRLAGGKAGRLVSLKGWNLRPDGQIETLSRSDLGTSDPDRYGTVTTRLVQAGELPRVAEGSLVAFESEEVERQVVGPVHWFTVAEDLPVRRWELCRGGGGFFASDKKAVPIRMLPRHWQAWGLEPEPLPGGGIAAGPIPARSVTESALPSGFDWLPRVEVVFLDPDLQGVPDLASWDGLARWYYGLYRDGLRSSGRIASAGLGPLEGLRAVQAWMAKELIFKQVYLSPARGWMPQDPAETIRRRNGDCKDHALCFLAEAAGLGFQGFPVLCRIQDGAIEPDAPPSPLCFNHAIAALKLEHPMGLPAEVETPKGRFLLVDTTDRFCPLGLLPNDHRGRSVLICTPDGALWAKVPEAAVVQPGIAIELKGTATGAGAASASATLRETGDALGLRSSVLYGNRDGLRKRLLETVFQMPTDGRLEVVSSCDPLDLDHPFEVKVNVACPDGLNRAGSGLALVPWGLPDAPGALRNTGKPRQGPVHQRSHRIWELTAEWDLPRALQPRLPGLDLDSPFRRATWQASIDGTRLRAVFHEETRDADFPFDRREQGTAQWKKDRVQMEQLHLGGFAFSIQGPA